MYFHGGDRGDQGERILPPPSQKIDQGDGGDLLGLLRLLGELLIDQGENNFLLGLLGVLSCKC